MAAQRLSAVLLRLNAARASICDCLQLETFLPSFAPLSLSQHCSVMRGVQLKHGGAQIGANDVGGSSEVARSWSTSAPSQQVVQSLIFKQADNVSDLYGWQLWKRAANGTSPVLGCEDLTGAAKRSQVSTIPWSLPKFSKTLHSSTRKQKSNMKRPLSQDAVQNGTSTTTFNDKCRAPGIKKVASKEKQLPPHKSALEDGLQDGGSALSSDKSVASVDKRAASDNKSAAPPIHRVLKAGDPVTSAVWMIELRKRNKVLEPAVQKLIAGQGEEKLHELLEDLQAKWRRNGASACGRMIYCLKRLIEMKDVDRTLVVRIRFATLRSVCANVLLASF